ncbi:hypothetical protein SAMN05192529_1259 [Arachidicoccus rhizosphaerae]|jgi:hypothetical protein|uniref:DUF5683 domain-containing protein n=1 Tax=Arachidicoccus rhizosphaerae TaxID=551991 RepID=A0A1H4BWK0_9BACT|nr:DUF5683 domain-containing protein [Arachidicoccus rhizosphaerae]SEA52453.1 hypothetical protein SAMN05192529_1259 [Arachidicoccus rhizosphaerae]
MTAFRLRGFFRAAVVVNNKLTIEKKIFTLVKQRVATLGTGGCMLLGICCANAQAVIDTTAPSSVNVSVADTAVLPVASQTDSSHLQQDSTLKRALRPFSLHLPGSKEHTPKGATIRSLILPGWGQAYNREYWKVPLAVAAVGIPVYLYFSNSKEYNSARTAYNVVFEEMPVISGGKGKLDAAKFAKLDQKFQDAYNSYKEQGGNYVTNYLSTLQSYRNTFRQYRDYSVVAALLGWGLQIADATVFGHLYGFDVSDDLSMQVKPVYFQYAKIPGIGVSFTLK